MRIRFKNEILLGLFFLVVIGLMIYMFNALGGASMADEIEVTGHFDSASGLVKDNYVMVAGVPVGRVEKIEVDFDRALIRMRIEKKVGLRQDVRARIRAKSLLGEKFVELIPGEKGAPLLQDGGLIRSTESPLEIDEVMGMLRPFFKQLDPMAPKIDEILVELTSLLKLFNESGKNKQETVEAILDRTDKLLMQANGILERNEEKLNRSADRLDKLMGTMASRAPELMNQADRTLKRIDAIAQAAPIDTIRKIPETYEKLDRTLDSLADITARADISSERLERILKNLDILLERALAIDELTLRKFLQEEGVNINLTQDGASRERIELLEKKASKPDK